MKVKVRSLVEFIAEEMEADPTSGMLFPGGPIWNVNAKSLLDKIGEIWGLTEYDIGSIVNPIRKSIEENRA